MISANSTTFIKRPPNVTPLEECLLYTKKILNRRLFLGSYVERRYVPVIGEYRDVVIISNEETEFCEDLDKVKNKCLEFSNPKWLGITGPDVKSHKETHQLWVKLSKLAFGSYWFQIKHVRIIGDELVLQLKCIRKAVPSSQEVPATANANVKSYQGINYDIKYVEAFKTLAKEKLTAIQTQLTFANFIEAVKITIVIVVTIVAGFCSGLQIFANFFLRLLHEVTGFISVCTPIIIHLIDFFSKIIGGIFILINALFTNHPQRHYNNYKMISYHSQKNVSHNRSQSQNLYEALPSTELDWRQRNKQLKEELETFAYHNHSQVFVQHNTNQLQNRNESLSSTELEWRKRNRWLREN